MNSLATLAVEIDPAIRADVPLLAAVEAANSYFREGLDSIDTRYDTPAANPELRWGPDPDEKEAVRIVYREDFPAQGLQVVLRRVPVSQLLDGVGRRSWMLKLLQYINGRRYDRAIRHFEKSIQEYEEAEQNGK